MKLDWQKLPRPIVALSPMADMTDSAFCRTVRAVVGNEDVAGNVRTTSPLIVFREMVSSEAIVRGNDKTLSMTEIHPDERPLVQQIFGSDPAVMAESARIIESQHHPEGIDINMGCPVYKLTCNFNGASLMRDPERAAAIVRAMKAVVTVPLSVKIRAGWSKHDEAPEFAKHLEAAGADLLTVHGRTKEQGYAGKSDRQAVAAVKRAVMIPVLYNGDVFSNDDYFAALEESGCDGCLIARGALGNPWIFQQIMSGQRGPIAFDERLRVIRSHLDLHLAQYGVTALPTFRKHLTWYFKGLPNLKLFKDRLMRATDRPALEAIFDEMASST